MPSNLLAWDTKHRAAAGSQPAEPASIVCELLPILPNGPALDLACGAGRHTMLLAQRPQPVTAVDGSGVALDLLVERARAENLAVYRTNDHEIFAETRNHHVRLVQADLERTSLPVESFALILCIQYLQRSLHPQIERALFPGGMLVFETYTRAQLDFAGGPRNPAFLLEPGELRDAFPLLEVLFYSELWAGQGIATLVAQKSSAGK